MGTIVINQTDCKQNVVLQSSVDGITGGFYDADGVWHELGGSTVDPILQRDLVLKALTYAPTPKVAYISGNVNNARAHMELPVIGTGFRIAVTDPTKYKVDVFTLSDLTLKTATVSGTTYPGFGSPSDSPDWMESFDTEDGGLYWFYFKKENGDFTADELTSPLGKIYTVE